MKKSIEIIDARPVIKTTNGVSTITAATYARKKLEFEPLPNGFNLAMADHIYDIIRPKNRTKTGSVLWNQGAWRKVLGDLSWDPSADRAAKSEAKRISGDTLAYENRCQTAMCVAGWVAELDLANWVMDAQDLAGELYVDESILNEIMVTREELETMSKYMDSRIPVYEPWDRLDVSAQEKLRKRGFTQQKHTAITAPSYAMWRLGLWHGDWLGLFGATNDLERIRRIIDVYAEYGPVPNGEGYVQLYGEQEIDIWVPVDLAPTPAERVMEYYGWASHRTCPATLARQQQQPALAEA